MSTYCYPIQIGTRVWTIEAGTLLVLHTDYLRELTLPVYMHVYSEVGICHGKPIPIQPNYTVQPSIPATHSPSQIPHYHRPIIRKPNMETQEITPIPPYRRT